MKYTGLTAAALAAVMTIACGGGTSNEANRENPSTTVGTGGDIGDNREAGAGMAQHQGATGDVQAFVRDVSMGNTAEIELGRLATERAQSNDVKQYGQMMIDDHTKAGAELKTAIAAHNIPMPQQMDEQHQQTAQRLRGLSGMEFDREYIAAMVENHERKQDMLEPRVNDAGANNNNNNNSAQGAEMAVNQWAAKTLPVVQKHLQRAEQLRDQLNNNRRQTQNNSNTGAGTRTQGQ